MSFPLSTLGFSLASIHIKKPINHFGNTEFSVCAKCAKKKDDVESTRFSIRLNRTKPKLKQLVTSCSKLSGKEDVSLDSGSNNYDGLRTKFEEVYSVLKSEILNDPAFEWTPDSRLWVEQMLDYNVPRGVPFSLNYLLDFSIFSFGTPLCYVSNQGHYFPGFNTEANNFLDEFGSGLYVIKCYKLLKGGEELSEEEVFDAGVMDWCFKWFFAWALILDDVMDNSHTRWDRPCWHRLPKVGNIAINDGALLFAHIPRILKKHFREKPYYMDLLDLFNEAFFLATFGQMLDLIGERDLSNYTMDNFLRIVLYKTVYPLYIPVAGAMLMAGENLENDVNSKELLLEIGIHMQIVNDYLDCFGNPKNTGKIGTDIESFKCSWLVVKALELANEEQKKIIQDHYGKANPSDVAKVKAVYDDMDLQLVFAMYESKSSDKIARRIEANPKKALRGIWASYDSYRQLAKMQALQLK